MPYSAQPCIHGVDFTSAPRKAKPITVASGVLASRGRQFRLLEVETFPEWAGYEAWLARPGPWIGGFDFPFGLPREAVRDLGWPDDWRALVGFCHAMGRPAFRAALDAYRESRPAGRRYAHRAADHPAKSHSPLKLVNPPVALMFVEGTKRLVDAGVTVPTLAAGDPNRIALEAYPGLAARAITRASYKSDEVAKQTPDRRDARAAIVSALIGAEGPFDFRLDSSPALARTLVSDASGDTLDAVIAAMQAAWGWNRRRANYGLPADVDPVEGWIVMA